MRTLVPFALSLALAQPAQAQWSEGVVNYPLDHGPWSEGYIPTPPAGESYRRNAEVMENGAEISPNAAFLAWVWNVRHGGVWDYKRLATRETFIQLEATGNFNFGVTAAAQGLPYVFVQLLAGIENAVSIFGRNFDTRRLMGGEWALGPDGLRVELPVWHWTSPFYYGPSAYFDDPTDAVSIKAGYDWYMRQSHHPAPPPPATVPDEEFGDNGRFRDFGPPAWEPDFDFFDDDEPDEDVNPFDIPDAQPAELEPGPKEDEPKKPRDGDVRPPVDVPGPA